jgi:hypothetical protein
VSASANEGKRERGRERGREREGNGGREGRGGEEEQDSILCAASSSHVRRIHSKSRQNESNGLVLRQSMRILLARKDMTRSGHTRSCKSNGELEAMCTHTTQTHMGSQLKTDLLLLQDEHQAAIQPSLLPSRLPLGPPSAPSPRYLV